MNKRLILWFLVQNREKERGDCFSKASFGRQMFLPWQYILVRQIPFIPNFKSSLICIVENLRIQKSWRKKIKLLSIEYTVFLIWSGYVHIHVYILNGTYLHILSSQGYRSQRFSNHPSIHLFWNSSVAVRLVADTQGRESEQCCPQLVTLGDFSMPVYPVIWTSVQLLMGL